MQNYKEQQGEITKPSSVINAKKQRKTTEWEDQRFIQENQRYQGNITCKDGLNKVQKLYGPNKQKILRRAGKNTQNNYTKKRSS